MPKPKAYIETTVISYLTARPSRDVVVAGHQQSTRDWWEGRRAQFRLFSSQLVLQEAGRGDPDAAGERIEKLRQTEALETTAEAVALSGKFIEGGPLPQKAAEDALHIGIAVVNGMDYLLTWNLTHLANAALRNKIDQICRSNGYEPAVICTPEELME